ncbi:hypothetical protein L1I79_22580 [Strepomyces sp. STD 3.1]|nr:hypothetical protein [Streptomyces sp. STD 3.1]
MSCTPEMDPPAAAGELHAGRGLGRARPVAYTPETDPPDTDGELHAGDGPAGRSR